MRWPRIRKREVGFTDDDRQCMNETYRMLMLLRSEVNKCNRKLDEIKRVLEK